MVACGLLAAPLQAEHIAYDVTVTITETVVEDDKLKFDVSIPGFVYDSSQQTGLKWTIRPNGGEWDHWFDMGMSTSGSGSVEIWDLTEEYGDGPWTLAAKAWNMRKIDGEWHLTWSDQVEETVDPDAE